MSKTAGTVSRARLAAALGVVGASLALVACGSSSSSSSGTSSSASSGSGAAATTSSSASSGKHLKITYLSFAVTNSYDAPMLAAAQEVAAANNASLTVFDVWV
jgi:ribose transport system substrate-binding protein